ncbi:MAG: SHOCT domain-containing protein [Clostridia bacterium]|nr:SHOCT domain-containing protein [Clostridia bacterium]
MRFWRTVLAVRIFYFEREVKMVCSKCGKKLSFFSDITFKDTIEGQEVTLCEDCHNSINVISCALCGKELSLINNKIYPGNVDGKDVNLCEECYGKSHQNNPPKEEPKKIESKPKAKVAHSMKGIAYVILIVCILIGGFVGWTIDDAFDEFPIYIGAAIGLAVGLLSTLFIRYLAELGENTQKTANATMTQAETQTQSSQNPSVTQELLEYKHLLDEGVITQEEFDAKKKQLLNL